MVRQSDNDQVTVVGAGVTLHEALEAADILAKEGKCLTPSSGSGQTLQFTPTLDRKRVLMQVCV